MRAVELGAEEKVLSADRLHPIVLAAPLAKAIVGLAVLVALFLGWASAPAWFGLLLGAGLVVAAAYVLAHVLTWRAGLVMVTTERVIHRFGLMQRVGREIPIHKIADVASRQGPLGQLLGYGELVVESIGASTARPIGAVRRPQAVQRAIHQAERMAALGRQAPAPGSGEQGSDRTRLAGRDVPHSGGQGAGW